MASQLKRSSSLKNLHPSQSQSSPASTSTSKPMMQVQMQTPKSVRWNLSNPNPNPNPNPSSSPSSNSNPFQSSSPNQLVPNQNQNMNMNGKNPVEKPIPIPPSSSSSSSSPSRALLHQSIYPSTPNSSSSFNQNQSSQITRPNPSTPSTPSAHLNLNQSKPTISSPSTSTSNVASTSPSLLRSRFKSNLILLVLLYSLPSFTAPSLYYFDFLDFLSLNLSPSLSDKVHFLLLYSWKSCLFLIFYNLLESIWVLKFSRRQGPVGGLGMRTQSGFTIDSASINHSPSLNKYGLRNQALINSSDLRFKLKSSPKTRDSSPISNLARINQNASSSSSLQVQNPNRQSPSQSQSIPSPNQNQNQNQNSPLRRSLELARFLSNNPSATHSASASSSPSPLNTNSTPSSRSQFRSQNSTQFDPQSSTSSPSPSHLQEQRRRLSPSPSSNLRGIPSPNLLSSSLNGKRSASSPISGYYARKISGEYRGRDSLTPRRDLDSFQFNDDDSDLSQDSISISKALRSLNDSSREIYQVPKALNT